MLHPIPGVDVCDRVIVRTRAADSTSKLPDTTLGRETHPLSLDSLSSAFHLSLCDCRNVIGYFAFSNGSFSLRIAP